MNPLIMIMLFFSLLGAIDRILGNHLELGVELERGMSQLGACALSVVGFYCIGVNGIQEYMDDIVCLAEKLPFDISLIPGVLLAADMGGLPIAVKISDNGMGLLSGLLICSGIGCLLSFQLPMALSLVKEDELGEMLQGLIPGIIAVPAGILVGGGMLGISVPKLLYQLIPIWILCGGMVFGFLRKPVVMQKILTGFGIGIRALGTLFFCIIVFGLFWEPAKLVEDELVAEILIILMKVCVFVGGSLVFAKLIMRYASRVLRKCADFLGVNIESVIGLMLGFVSGAGMLPFFSRMDRKGRLMNSAFSVMGAYVFGGQMSFVAGQVNGYQLSVYIVGKLVAGILAIVLVHLQMKREEKAR